MAGVTETATWENHVYRIEENDPVHGGENGVTNKPIKHLANRTLYLRKLLTEAGQRIVPLKITATTKNTHNLTGHTHEVELASLTTKGLVQLTNDTSLDSEVLALTAKGAKAITQSVAQLQQTTTTSLNQKVAKTDVSDAVNSSSQSTVASSKAVKTTYDLAEGKLSKTGDTATGNYTFNNGNITQTGAERTIESNYRMRVNRNSDKYAPYFQLINGNLDLENPVAREIGNYCFYVKEGSAERIKSIFKTNLLTDKNVFVEVGTYNAAQTYQVVWKNFSATNNTVFGKGVDDGVNRVQINGTVAITAPESAANNNQVPTTAWVRALAKPIADTKVSKAGDTMTGTLVVPQIKVTQNNQGGKNIQIGDDAWIGDDALAHTVKIKSSTDEAKGFIAFGSLTNRLGNGLAYPGNNDFLEWEGNYFSLNVKNAYYSGINFQRSGTSGNFWSRIEALPDKRFKFVVESSYEIFTPIKSGTLALVEDVTPNLIPLFKGEFHNASDVRNVTVGSTNGNTINLAQSFKNFRYVVIVISNDGKTEFDQKTLHTSLIPVGNTGTATWRFESNSAFGWVGRFIANNQVTCVGENCVLHAIYGTNAL